MMLQASVCIYYQSRPSHTPEDLREVEATRISNLNRALFAAAGNGQAHVIPTLLSFATQQGMDWAEVITRRIIMRTIQSGNAAVLRALASADLSIINFPLGHGALPLYEATRLRKPDVVAALLELSADPLHPLGPHREMGSFHTSLLSRAALSGGYLDVVHLLQKRGADLDEVLSTSHDWTPMHFAAWRGRKDAMEFLQHSGARSDLKDSNGKRAMQVLEEHGNAR
ncbi:hypothetical protein ANO11243_080510 [Dothideomycetidae sp. 11243]|nr:hypothetical protein ANO11243_080510 [fungal sp. No.11243]